MATFVKLFKDIDEDDRSLVGEKNAFLGAMLKQLGPKGIKVPPGYATTAFAYWFFLDHARLRERLWVVLEALDRKHFRNLATVGSQARTLILQAQLPREILQELKMGYGLLTQACGEPLEMLVRSSVIAEEQPTTGLDEQQQTCRQVNNLEQLLSACHHSYADFFSDEAIKYRVQHGIDHLQLALSVRVQRLSASGKSCSGKLHTFDPQTEFRNALLISGHQGLEEPKGQQESSDVFVVYKPMLEIAAQPIISHKKGRLLRLDNEETAQALPQLPSGIQNPENSAAQSDQYVLQDEEVLQLARWGKLLEDYHEIPMHMDWAKDGFSGELYVLQARPAAIECRPLRKLEKTKVKSMLLLDDPEQAFKFSFLPHEGVGLMRLEYTIRQLVGVHPLALKQFEQVEDAALRENIEALTHHSPNKEDYFVNKLAEAVAMVAAAFFPKEVRVRMSDLHTDQYTSLVGGEGFTQQQPMPMRSLWAARPYPQFPCQQVFEMECRAIRKVREEMGLNNVKLVVPFCKSTEEAKMVVELLAAAGLRRGVKGLELLMAVDVPADVLLAGEYARYFDGFSIDARKLSHLRSGSAANGDFLRNLFSPIDPAVKQLIQGTVEKARRSGLKSGFCGQASRDSDRFAYFLVINGIDSISFAPEDFLRGVQNVLKAEKELSMLVDRYYM